MSQIAQQYELYRMAKLGLVVVAHSTKPHPLYYNKHEELLASNLFWALIFGKEQV